MVPDLDRPSAEAIPLLYGVADNLIDVKRFCKNINGHKAGFAFVY